MFGFLRRWFPKTPERDNLRESEDASWNKFVQQEGVTYEISPRVEKIFLPAQVTLSIIATHDLPAETYEFQPGDMIWKIFTDCKTYQYYRGQEVCREGWYYIEREKNPIPLEAIEAIIDCGMASECLSTRFQFPILVREQNADERAQPSSANTN